MLSEDRAQLRVNMYNGVSAHLSIQVLCHLKLTISNRTKRYLYETAKLDRVAYQSSCYCKTGRYRGV